MPLCLCYGYLKWGDIDMRHIFSRKVKIGLNPNPN